MFPTNRHPNHITENGKSRTFIEIGSKVKTNQVKSALRQSSGFFKLIEKKQTEKP